MEEIFTSILDSSKVTFSPATNLSAFKYTTPKVWDGDDFSTTLATADRMVMNDAGTMKQVA